MEHDDWDKRGGAAPPEATSAPAGERYEPPEVAWEEEFKPIAASCDPLGGDC